MTPDQSRALARWLAVLPPDEAAEVKARFRGARDEWATLTPAEQEAAMLRFRETKPRR